MLAPEPLWTVRDVFPIDDASVSSYHAQISKSGGIYLLKDLGSTNGTIVNGVKTTAPIALRAGDEHRGETTSAGARSAAP